MGRGLGEGKIKWCGMIDDIARDFIIPIVGENVAELYQLGRGGSQ